MRRGGKLGIALVGAIFLVLIHNPRSRAEIAPGFESGNALKAVCEATTSYERAECFGYIEAIWDAMAARNSINGFKICRPTSETGITVGQIRDVVLMFLNSHPEVRHNNAAGLVAGAFNAAFPCLN
jgi:hypothetical protein